MKHSKLIAVIIAAVLIMPSASAQETKAVFEENFNGMTVGELPKGVDPRETDPTGIVRVQAVPSASDKSVMLHNNAPSDSQAFVQKQFSSPLTGKIEIKYSMMIESANKRISSFPGLRDSNGVNVSLVNFEQTGKIALADGMEIGNYTTGKWQNYTIMLDLQGKTFDFYINGAAAAQNAAMSTGLENISLIRFHLQNILAKVYLDNISVYTGASETPVQFASVAEESEQSEPNIMINENFNSYITGEKPENSLAVKSAGEADAAVVDEPDAKNKSLFLRCGGSGSAAYAAFKPEEPQKEMITFAFKLMFSSKQTVNIPLITDSTGAQHTLLDIRGGVLMHEETAAAEFEPGKWYNIELSVNPQKKVFSVKIGENKVIKNGKINIIDVSEIRFRLNREGQELYIDDMYAVNGSTGGNTKREYYDSAIFLTDAQQEEVDEILFGALAMSVGSKKAYISGTELQSDYPPVEEQDGMYYIPLRFAAENFGAEITWQEKTKTALMQYNEKTIKFTENKDIVCINGKSSEICGAPRIYEGAMYVPAKALAQVLEKEFYTEKSLILIGSDPQLINEAEPVVRNEVMNMVKYLRPTGKQMLSDLEAYSANNAHPRLLATAEDFERVKHLIQTDETASNMFKHLKASAESVLKTQPAEYSLKENDLRLGPAVTLVPSRVEATALMYRLTGDTVYAERAWRELEAACEFPDWNHKHYLDTGGMMAAAAIGYDWLYDYLNDAQKEKLRSAILEKGVNIGLDIFRGKYNATYLMSFWINSPYNWNAHCNAGLIMCCLALGNEAREVTEPLLGYIMRSFEYALNEFEPDGAWEEGPSYWNTNVYDDVRILSSLETALGTNYGYFNVPGIRETCYYPLYVMGTDGTFNYSDSDKTKRLEIQHQFWMASHLEDPNLGYQRKSFIQNSNWKCSPCDLLWYSPEYCGSEMQNIETDKYFRKTETVTMRGSWDEETMFAGFHSGNTDQPHTHLDTGSFVLDYGNVRWVEDLGTDRVTYTGTSGFRAYRTRAEGHNTLVMNNSAYIANEMPADEDGWLELMNYQFDNIETGGQPSLDVREGGSGTVKVVEIPDAENKSLRIACEDKESATQAFIQQQDFDPPLASGMKINFKFMRENMTGNISFPALRDSENNEFSVIELKENGTLCAYNGETLTELQKYEAGKWYDVSIKLDMQKGKMDISIDGISVAEHYTFRKPLTDIKLMRIAVYRQATALLLDNLSVYVHPNDSAAVVQTANQQDQNSKAYCYITRYESKPKGVIAVTDMTEAYETWADSAVRGVFFTNNRRAFVVRDEVKLKTTTDLYWFAHTMAEVTVSDDGKSAVLKQNGKQMWVGILSEDNARFEVMDARPLPTSPDPEGQLKNEKYKKLAIKLSGVKQADLSVAFMPLAAGKTVPDDIPSAESIEHWQIPDGEILMPETITVNGSIIEDFKPEKAFYSLVLTENEQIPEIGAQAAGAQVTVKQAESLPGTAEIRLTKDGNTSVYFVNINVKKITAASISGYPVDETNIDVSSVQEPENPPEATIDGNLETRWAAEGMGEWITYDLQQQRLLEKIELAWYRGAERVYSFEIHLSTDGLQWNRVFEGTSSGKTGDTETYTFTPQEARFIKITGYGSNVNAWNNIAEIR